MVHANYLAYLLARLVNGKARHNVGTMGLIFGVATSRLVFLTARKDKRVDSTWKEWHKKQSTVCVWELIRCHEDWPEGKAHARKSISIQQNMKVLCGLGCWELWFLI